MQHSMGLLAEWRVPLWEACTRPIPRPLLASLVAKSASRAALQSRGEDPQLKGVITLSSWRRICRRTTSIYIDWVLVARLVGGASQNHLRYMETLNRFGFEIASQAKRSGGRCRLVLGIAGLFA